MFGLDIAQTVYIIVLVCTLIGIVLWHRRKGGFSK